MTESPFEMSFDLMTIKHLGLQMYSTLPPALAEIISNSYDADAANVTIRLSETEGRPEKISVEDDGIGLSSDEINTKFLIIGRDRRKEDGDNPSPMHNRRPTGKKGLGKLALFGLANTITVSTRKDGMHNELILDWEALNKAEGSYYPLATRIDEETEEANGTVVTLTALKRESPFDPEGLANSLSRIFLFDDTFKVTVESPSGTQVLVDNKRRYDQLDQEFEWDLSSPSLVPSDSKYFGKISGKLITSEKPLTPSSGLRGITLLSRGKLVNAPECFSSSTSSHFYQYLTGWISADFIDLLDEDVISTNRQSINWEHPEMAEFRRFLSTLVAKVGTDWRQKRKEKKKKDLEDSTGLDTDKWMATMPPDIKENASRIIETLGGEDALENYPPIIDALHKIVPEYPLYHWRHLHSTVQEASEEDYQKEDYYRAFIEAAKRYITSTRQKSGTDEKNDFTMMGSEFGANSTLSVAASYKKPDGAEFPPATLENIENGQKFYSMGVVAGGRNPLAHEEISDLRESGLFTELDCLDALSLLSHVFRRLDDV